MTADTYAAALDRMTTHERAALAGLLAPTHLAPCRTWQPPQMTEGSDAVKWVDRYEAPRAPVRSPYCATPPERVTLPRLAAFVGALALLALAFWLVSRAV